LEAQLPLDEAERVQASVRDKAAMFGGVANVLMALAFVVGVVAFVIFAALNA
jgi:hypothetical protein